MTLNEFLDEYENLTLDRRHRGMQAFLKELCEHTGYYEHTIHELMCEFAPDESMDVFGTEGMNI